MVYDFRRQRTAAILPYPHFTRKDSAMELAEKYAYTVWEKKSFSEAAKILFVSQPSLSATIAQLEKKRGFKIFDRSTHPLSLTLRGKIYIDYLEGVFEQENTLNERLRSVSEESSGSLIVGGRMGAFHYVLPYVCGEFYRHHPHVNISIDMEPSNEKMQNKSVDLLFSFQPDVSERTSIPLMRERMIVAVHKNHPCALPLTKYAVCYEEVVNRKIPADRELDDLSLFADLPFIKTGTGSDSDKRLSALLPEHKVSPCIVANAKNFDMRYRLMAEGLGALLVSDLTIANLPQNRNDLLFFALKDSLSFRTLYIQYRTDHTDNETLNQFVKIAAECCQYEKLLLHTRTLMRF